MAEFQQVVPGFFVAGQITGEDVARAAADGFAMVVINRPDGETPGQPDHRAITALAQERGMTARYVPVVPGQLGPEEVDGIKAALAEASGPVLAYCAGGMRSTALWAFAQVGAMPAEDIIKAAAEAGFDLSGLRRHLG